MSTNPHWAFLMSAMLTPVVAVLTAYIAYRQWSTGHYRLKFDLFEKRYQIYFTLREFQRSVMGSGRVEQEKHTIYIEGIREARWLFGKKVFDYLHDDVSASALLLQTLVAEMEGMPSGKQKSELVRKQSEYLKKLSKELERADTIFEPYLDVSRVVNSRGLHDRWRAFFRLPPN